MPYFHAIAVFEARGSSSAEADRAAAALFKTVRHPRVHYYEHDTSGGLGSPQKTTPLSFTVIADFDVEAGNEESAADLVEETLDSLSTEAIQYFAHGITVGEQRVRSEQRAQHAVEHAAEPAPERETHLERGDREERGGRKRGPRGRGRRRGGAREAEGGREEESEVVLTPLPQEEPVAISVQTEAPPPETPREESAVVEVRMQERELPPPLAETVEVASSLSPPRSSAAMRVTLTVTLHASELPPPTNGSALPEQRELLRMATVEARRRHPELPAEVTPQCEVVSLPWGDTLLALTWHYNVPVPSSADAG